MSMLNITNKSLQNTSYQTNQSVINWIHTNFSSPHCHKLKQICDLKYGVAIAEILTQILPQNYHSLLLSKIQVNNLNSNTCINNFKTIKSVLTTFCSSHNISDIVMVNQYLPQNLYYRDTDLLKFMNNVIKKLWEISINNKNSKQLKAYQNKDNKSGRDMITYCNTIAAHLLPQSQSQQFNKSNSFSISNSKYNTKKQSKNINNENINVSQLSDIVNCSNIQYRNYLNAHNENENENENQNDLQQLQNNTNYIVNNTKNINTNAFTQYYTQQNENYKNKYSDRQQQQQQHKLITQQQIQMLQQWVNSKLGYCPIDQPHRLLGQVINSIFCSSRLNDYIIKDAHFEHGPIFVYRKALQFLLTHTLADRVNKNNILAMMKSVQEDGVLRQTQFWKVIKDIYQYDINKGKYNRSRSRNNSHHNNTHNNSKGKQNNNNKQNLNSANINTNNNIKRQQSIKTLSKCKTSKQTLSQNQNIVANKLQTYPKITYNKTDTKNIQQWIIKQLGYQHSLTKSKNSLLPIFQNQLLNGTLIASILMRYKIGKPIINKLPNNIMHVKGNWDQINKICILRGYQAFKKILTYLQYIEKYDRMEFINFCLSVLKEFKDQYGRKNPQNKNKDSYRSVKDEKNKNCNQCVWNAKQKKNINTNNNYHSQHNNIYNYNSANSHNNIKQQKQQIKQWLFKNHSIQIPLSPNSQSLSLSTSQLTQICRNLLNINIYKETTQRIQINNVQKILGELRRIGLSDYYQMNKQDVMKNERDSQDLRWKILWDLKWVIDGKVQFCHA